jgi:hypothetical protein
MKLSDILPHDLICAQFPDRRIIVETLGLPEIRQIAKSEPDCLYSIATHVINRTHTRNWAKCHMQKLIARVEAKDPYIYEGVSKLLGEPSIKDIFWARLSLDDDSLSYKRVAMIMVAHVFRNDVELGDILLQNPYEPLQSGGFRPTYKKFKGLGLFGEVMDRLRQFGNENECEQITLTAASADQIPFFKKFGFRLEYETPRSVRNVGAGGGMEYDLVPQID